MEIDLSASHGNHGNDNTKMPFHYRLLLFFKLKHWNSFKTLVKSNQLIIHTLGSQIKLSLFLNGCIISFINFTQILLTKLVAIATQKLVYDIKSHGDGYKKYKWRGSTSGDYFRGKSSI